MITKYCKTKTYHEVLLPKNSHNPLDMGSRGTHWTSREHQIFTITMRMVTKLYKVVTYPVEVPPINSSDPSMRLSQWGQVGNWKLYRHICRKTYGYQTRQVVDLPWEATTLKATRHFDQVTNVKSGDNLNNWFVPFRKTYLSLNLVVCWL